MNEKPDRRIKKGVELMGSLHRAMKSKTAAMGIPLWRGWEMAVCGWLGKEAEAQRYVYDEANRALHDKLESVLNSGDDMAVLLMAPILEFMFERLRPSKSRGRINQ